MTTGRARFLVAYRGTAFRGFAANEGVRTVEGELATAFETVLRRPVDITCAGRTDAGVHAWGQVITVDIEDGRANDEVDTPDGFGGLVDLDQLATRINKLCRPDISVRDPEWVDTGFDARFSATSRSYRYQVWNHSTPNPLIADQAWHVARPLDLSAMQHAASDLEGEHDFSSFCRRPSAPPGTPEPSLVRILYLARWGQAPLPRDDADVWGAGGVRSNPLLIFEVTGSAFCHQQVRSMVGTCVDIGLGRLSTDSVPSILAAKDRNAAGQVAPPHGLTLWNVGYEGARWDA